MICSAASGALSGAFLTVPSGDWTTLPWLTKFFRARSPLDQDATENTESGPSHAGHRRTAPGETLLTTALDTTRLPLRERQEAWIETTALASVTQRFTFQEPDAFRARIDIGHLGSSQLSMLSYERLRSQRTPRLIRQSDPEVYQIALIMSGCQVIEQNGRRAALGPGELVLFDSSRPFDGWVDTDGGRARSVIFQFPKTTVPLREKDIADLYARPLPARQGIGSLLNDLLSGVIKAHDGLTPYDTVRLGNTASDLTTALLAHYSEAMASVCPETRHHVLFIQATEFIGRHLHDQALGPTLVSAAQCVSTRHLHRVFKQAGTSVAAYIREQRLNRCRQDLVNPSLQSLPIGAIGARWGFSRHSVFTRTFRTAFGVSPSEYRDVSSRHP
ncbi:helix-turn-helix domain-containing protein [Streptomyces somaliensis DSM 40738]|uniref:Helix-turn-helix domain-containing protein n=1 Tax=Streptomyces somaliensis (strain ATCC 33201 / DSM 40738 / JCM 12659 / KCTC 9044 / NCTC 11332 / NRRL B-12077 / IP 733) TaxID=1134445 RepID=A0AA44DCR1_STRE0|nr:helix-turn-helix domain-containing protein [Streptomyces somaliensis]MCQ0021832.1 helix-turn-helix domain-containing protein [Streptomyces somaliensis DSM 40738]NKY13796.1 helix-turn-helix domain-containing protein [Streptomyces somaliensis DSM 40738]